MAIAVLQLFLFQHYGFKHSFLIVGFSPLESDKDSFIFVINDNKVVELVTWVII